MYIKNPNKKVSYSFRIKPETLEDLKLYANATNNTVPEILNQLITDKLDGVTLTNDYLKHFQDQLITVPDLQTIYDNNDLVKMYEEIDLLNPNLNGTVFRVKKVPNNLDVWDNTDNLLNQHGYTSWAFPDSLHEGIEFVLAPELLKPDILNKDNPEIILTLQNSILLPIWFRINYHNMLEIRLITFREAIKTVNLANNFTLMDKLSNFKVLTDNIITEVVTETPKDELYTTLSNELSKIARQINTGNILVNVTPEGKIQYDKIKFKAGDKSEITKILEENQALKTEVKDLQTKVNALTEISQKVNDLEERVKIWEELKTKSKK